MRKIIIFDLGGILEHHDIDSFCNWIKNKFNIDKDIKPVYKEIEIFVDTGKIDQHEFFKRFTEAINISISEEEFWEEYYKNHVIQFYDNLNFIKDELFGKYELFMFSNYAKAHREKFKAKYDYEALFKKCIYSFDIGVKKPDPFFFEKGLELINHKGEECIFIDDQLKSKEPSEKTGIKFIQFVDLEKLKSDLKELKLI